MRLTRCPLEIVSTVMNFTAVVDQTRHKKRRRAKPRNLLTVKAKNFGKRRFYTQTFSSKPIKIHSCDLYNV